MSKSGDNKPMAPRRSLQGPGPAGADDKTEKIRTQSRGAQGSDTRGAQAPSGPSYAPATGQSGSAPGQPQPSAAPGAGAEQPRHDTAQKDEAARQRREERAAQRERKRQPKQIRRAKLRVGRVDPWSITKTAFLLSIAFGIMCVVAVFLIFSIMNAAGLWDSINSAVAQVVGGPQNQDPFDITEYVGMDRVMGITVLVAVVDVVILTALATLGAFIYNMSASMLGGIEVTLSEDLN